MGGGRGRRNTHPRRLGTNRGFDAAVSLAVMDWQAVPVSSKGMSEDTQPAQILQMHIFK